MKAKISYQMPRITGSLELKVSALVKEIVAGSEHGASVFVPVFERRLEDLKSGNHMTPSLHFKAEMSEDAHSVKIWKRNFRTDKLLFIISFF